MATATPHEPNLTWLLYALLTVVCWGLYGIFLHTGQLSMSPAGGPADPNARYKAFLFVGVAYFITAVLAPLAVLVINQASWSFPGAGIRCSLLAGILGAFGAFGVLLAFGAAGRASYVPVIMSIIFAGAPIVNAITALSLHPPAGGWAKVPLPFYVGIVLAVVGASLVTLYKPAAGPAPGKPTAAHTPPTPEPPARS